MTGRNSHKSCKGSPMSQNYFSIKHLFGKSKPFFHFIYDWTTTVGGWFNYRSYNVPLKEIL